jgi:hypothetical protein
MPSNGVTFILHVAIVSLGSRVEMRDTRTYADGTVIYKVYFFFLYRYLGRKANKATGKKAQIYCR